MGLNQISICHIRTFSWLLGVFFGLDVSCLLIYSCSGSWGEEDRRLDLCFLLWWCKNNFIPPSWPTSTWRACVCVYVFYISLVSEHIRTFLLLSPEITSFSLSVSSFCNRFIHRRFSRFFSSVSLKTKTDGLHSFSITLLTLNLWIDYFLKVQTQERCK